VLAIFACEELDLQIQVRAEVGTADELPGNLDSIRRISRLERMISGQGASTSDHDDQKSAWVEGVV
jgi:hypothetical protein